MCMSNNGFNLPLPTGSIRSSWTWNPYLKTTAGAHEIGPEQRYSLCFLPPDPKRLVKCPGNGTEYKETSSPLTQGAGQRQLKIKNCKGKEGTNEGRARCTEPARPLLQEFIFTLCNCSGYVGHPKSTFSTSKLQKANAALSRSIAAFPFN